MYMKICTKCKQEKSLSEFNKKTKERLSSNCKTCQSEYWKSYYSNPEKRKRHVALNIKATALRSKKLKQIAQREKDKPCADCGIKYPYWIMQFDHIKGNKIDHIACMVLNGVSEEKLMAEIAKCEVVCANCHMDRTHKRRIGEL